MFYKVGSVVALLCGLTACTQPYETPPVEVVTPAGPVTCQLYSPDVVLWDSPLSFPAAMEKAEAESICRKEGMARKQGG